MQKESKREKWNEYWRVGKKGVAKKERERSYIDLAEWSFTHTLCGIRRNVPRQSSTPVSTRLDLL